MAHEAMMATLDISTKMYSLFNNHRSFSEHPISDADADTAKKGKSSCLSSHAQIVIYPSFCHITLHYEKFGKAFLM